MSETTTNELPASSLQKFRRATPDDVVFIARLLRTLYSKVSPAAYRIPYDHQSMIVSVHEVVSFGVCLVGPTSCAGAILCPFPSNRKAIIANVVFWSFVTPSEIRIFDHFCAACKEAGATHVNPSSHFPLNTIGRFYKKKGLWQSEGQWMGEL